MRRLFNRVINSPYTVPIIYLIVMAIALTIILFDLEVWLYYTLISIQWALVLIQLCVVIRVLREKK